MQILHIFHNYGVYTKAENSFEDRWDRNRQNTFTRNLLTGNIYYFTR